MGKENRKNFPGKYLLRWPIRKKVQWLEGGYRVQLQHVALVKCVGVDLLLIFHSFNSGSTLAIFLESILGGEVIFLYVDLSVLTRWWNYDYHQPPYCGCKKSSLGSSTSLSRRGDKNNNNGGSNNSNIHSLLRAPSRCEDEWAAYSMAANSNDNASARLRSKKFISWSASANMILSCLSIFIYAKLYNHIFNNLECESLHIGREGNSKIRRKINKLNNSLAGG